jgi:hypothetical protein
MCHFRPFTFQKSLEIKSPFSKIKMGFGHIELKGGYWKMGWTEYFPPGTKNGLCHLLTQIQGNPSFLAYG